MPRVLTNHVVAKGIQFHQNHHKHIEYLHSSCTNTDNRSSQSCTLLCLVLPARLPTFLLLLTGGTCRLVASRLKKPHVAAPCELACAPGVDNRRGKGHRELFADYTGQMLRPDSGNPCCACSKEKCVAVAASHMAERRIHECMARWVPSCRGNCLTEDMCGFDLLNIHFGIR